MLGWDVEVLGLGLKVDIVPSFGRVEKIGADLELGDQHELHG